MAPVMSCQCLPRYIYSEGKKNSGVEIRRKQACAFHSMTPLPNPWEIELKKLDAANSTEKSLCNLVKLTEGYKMP